MGEGQGKGKRSGNGGGGGRLERSSEDRVMAKQGEAIGEQGRVCLIGFAGWKDRDPEHSMLLSHSITAIGHIMRARAISSPQTDPSSHVHIHTHHGLHYRIQSSTFLAHLPAYSPVPT